MLARQPPGLVVFERPLSLREAPLDRLSELQFRLLQRLLDLLHDWFSGPCGLRFGRDQRCMLRRLQPFDVSDGGFDNTDDRHAPKENELALTAFCA